MNINPKIRSKSVTVRTRPETFKAWQRLAKKEGRSLTNMLEVAMARYAFQRITTPGAGIPKETTK